MDRDIKYCINQLYNAGQLTETNYSNLIECLEDYHELDRRTANYHAQYYLGEEVYSAKDYFSDNKNKICKFTIESISWDSKKKKFIYNYLYSSKKLFFSLSFFHPNTQFIFILSKALKIL